VELLPGSPQLRYNLALSTLRLDDYPAGFALTEARIDKPDWTVLAIAPSRAAERHRLLQPGEPVGRCGRPPTRRRIPGRYRCDRRGDAARRVRRRGGGHRSARHRRHDGGALRRRSGASGMAHAAAFSALVLGDRARSHPVVPDRAAVPTGRSTRLVAHPSGDHERTSHYQLNIN